MSPEAQASEDLTQQTRKMTWQEWREKNPDKQRASRQRWKQEHPDKQAGYVANWKAKHRHRVKAHDDRWRKLNLDKRRAHSAVHRALQKGILVRQLCHCGEASVHAHHHNGYENPLEVMWLCPTHHREIHGQKAR